MADNTDEVTDISNVLLQISTSSTDDPFSFDEPPSNSKRRKQPEETELTALTNDSPATPKLNGASFKNMGFSLWDNLNLRIWTNVDEGHCSEGLQKPNTNPA